MKAYFIITETNRQRIIDALRMAQVGDAVKIGEATRTLEQNALQWVYLAALSKQLEWPVMVNGQWSKQLMSEDDWKDFLTGAFEGEAKRMAMGIDNTGLVMLGARTSKYGKKKFSEYIEFLKAFCAQHNVSTADESREAA